jgi:hypothetical protein
MISIGKYMKNYTYFYKTFSQKELTNRTGGIIVYPKVGMKTVISVHQKHKKFFDENFTYSVLRLLVAEVDTNKEELKVVKTLKTSYKTQQVCKI